MKIRVLVIDDSALMRKLLTEIINAAPDLEVVGAAPDAATAREMIKVLNPDVLTLDVQMPHMDGLEFLERLMRLRPTPVVMVSAFTRAGSETTLRALELGALDFIAKPRAETAQRLEEYGNELADKIRAAKGARLQARKPSVASAEPGSPAAKPKPIANVSGGQWTGKIICLGASTGGTEAIKTFLSGMPANCPPILIVQHMPETFTASFAARLNILCQPTVVEARGGEIVQQGMVYIAPGHSHMLMRKGPGGVTTELSQAEPVNRHRPSVDVLFDAAATVLGNQAVGVILTGMGKDGAKGMLRMREAGARTFGQDEASCVVYGMPREAFLLGGVQDVVSLEQMSGRVLSVFGKSVT